MESRINRRRSGLCRGQAGFTLVEMMVVIVIIGIMATVLITYVAGQGDVAKQAAAKAHISQFDTAIQLFKLQNGRFPNSLTELANRPPDARNWPQGGYLKSVPKDPWGFEYVVRMPGSGDRPYEIWCFGEDGVPGGEGVKADISNYPDETK